MTIYCESPEKAQSHIQPLDVSPGLLLLMLSSVISEKLDVLQILQVWSAEQVANRLAMTTNTKTEQEMLRYPRMQSWFYNFISFSLKRTYYIHFWVFNFWTPIEQLDTTDQTIKSVDLKKTVPPALCLPTINCILSKWSV